MLKIALFLSHFKLMKFDQYYKNSASFTTHNVALIFLFLSAQKNYCDDTGLNFYSIDFDTKLEGI